MSVSDRIISEAIKLFVSCGIKSVTMDDIAKEIGVSKRTIYENFRDKDELLRECLLTNMSMQKCTSIEVKLNCKNVIEEILTILYEGIKNIEKINPSLMTDLKKFHYKIWNDIIIPHQKDKLKDFKVKIEEGINQNLFRKDINVDIVSGILQIQINSMPDDNIFPIDKYSRTDVISNIVINFLRGIATKKGIEIIEEFIEQKKNELKINQI
jgi:AcrR family transcriptional regulator